MDLSDSSPGFIFALPNLEEAPLYKVLGRKKDLPRNIMLQSKTFQRQSQTEIL